jgi:hypothetical protein
MSRIVLDDTVTKVMVKMCEGNPGALTVCAGLLKEGERIDPQAAFGGSWAVMMLDSLEIYGSRIWVLYKDLCGEDLVRLCAILRAWQLGHLSSEKIDHAIQFGSGVDVDAELVYVRGVLPEFVKETT